MKKEENKKSEIKVIVFDVGGVLMIPRYYIKKDGKEFSGIHEHIAHKLGIKFDEWFDAIDSLYVKSIIGEISREKFIDTVSKRLKINKKRLVRTIIDCYRYKMKKNLYLFQLVKKIRKNYVIGVLSDQWPLSREAIFPKKENKNFDFVIISYEVRVRKPHPEIYKLLMKKIHLLDKNGKCLFRDKRITRQTIYFEVCL